MKQLCLGAGIGWTKEPNQTLLDIRQFPGIDIVADLNEPWPTKDGEYDSIIAKHLVEHLKDLIHFMDEAHRTLSQGGELYIETPLAGGDIDLTHADPTHVRCYRKHTFINYFTKAGIAKFGYTNKAWCIMHIEERDQILIVHLMPIK